MTQIDYGQLTISQRNDVRQAVQQLIARLNGTTPHEVWVSLGQGSLIISTESEPNHPTAQWPNDEHIAATVEQARAGNKHRRAAKPTSGKNV